MSNLIAETTAALRDLLRNRIIQIAPDMADLVVTTEAPDQARGGRSMPQLNVFLFDAPVDRAFRDRDPAVVREDDVRVSGVTLRYLLTAYGREKEGDDLTGHRVLGFVMAVLEGQRALENIVPEPLRIARLEMTAIDTAALWTSFHTPFRLSVAYAIGPLPIESA